MDTQKVTRWHILEWGLLVFAFLSLGAAVYPALSNGGIVERTPVGILLVLVALGSGIGSFAAEFQHKKQNDNEVAQAGIVRFVAGRLVFVVSVVLITRLARVLF